MKMKSSKTNFLKPTRVRRHLQTLIALSILNPDQTKLQGLLFLEGSILASAATAPAKKNSIPINYIGSIPPYDDLCFDNNKELHQIDSTVILLWIPRQLVQEQGSILLFLSAMQTRLHP
jgi:hypothetical protein